MFVYKCSQETLVPSYLLSSVTEELTSLLQVTRFKCQVPLDFNLVISSVTYITTQERY